MESKEIKILAVDDNRDNLISLKALVREAFPDASIFMASDGEKGIELAIAQDPDLILLDIVMPGMDGFEVCQKLKADSTLSDIPVVFVTAIKGEKESRIRALEAGAEAFLAKPLDETELTAQIRAMIKIKNANIEKRDKEKHLTRLVADQVSELKETHLATLNLLEDLRKEIESRKKSEETLRESEEKFSLAFMTSPYAVTITRPEDGQFIEVNDAFYAMTGYTREETINNASVAMNLWADVEDRNQVVSELIAGVKVERREFHFKKKNGEILIGSFSAQFVQINNKHYILSSINDITERKQAETLLAQTRQNYETYFNTIDEFLFVLDERGNIIQTNNTVIERLGYTWEELSGKSVLMVHPPDRRNEAGRIIGEMLGGTSGFCTVPVITKSGVQIPVETKVSHGVWDGKPVIFGVTKDITQILLSEKKFSKVFYVNPSPCGLSDFESHRYIEVNEAFNALLGYDKNEVIGKTATELGIMTTKTMDALMLKADSNGRTTNAEAELMAKNGNLKHVLLSAEIISIQDKKYRFTVVHDITERKHNEIVRKIQFNIAYNMLLANNLEQLLEIIRNELKQLLDTTNFFLALYNPATDMLKQVIFIDQNDAFVEWKADESLSGQVVKQAKTLNLDRKGIAQLAAEKGLQLMGTPAESWLVVPLMRDKRAIGVMAIQSYTETAAYDEISTDLMEMVAHELSLFIERREMITDLVIAKDQAEESDRLKSAFLTNMSHEIRTPMNGILGFAGLLKEPGLSGEEQKEYIRIIEKSGTRMLNIINDIIDISKIEAGQMEISVSETNINEQIEYVYTFFKPEAEQKGIRLLINNTLPGKEAGMVTDREKIYAILTNLVKNAIKFCDKGTIEVGYNLAATKQDALMLQFYVKDTGIGIPRNRQQAIFDRFVQADIADKRAFQGAGLGLSISKAYVELLGGRIWVESEEGKGSTFYFTIPFNKKLQEKTIMNQDVKAGHEHGRIRNLKILIAEDDETSEMLVMIAVRMFGKEIIRVCTGTEAVEACRNNPDIDLVMMDIQMPEMDGYEATRRIREFNKVVVIIAQTAYALVGDREKAMEAGCNDYVSKPASIAIIKDLIQKNFKI